MSEGLETEEYPPAVAKATREFVEEADNSMVFFNRLHRTGEPEDFVSSSELISSFQAITGMTVMDLSSNAITQKISRWFKDQGHDGDKAWVKGNRGYRGWVIQSEEELG